MTVQVIKHATGWYYWSRIKHAQIGIDKNDNSITRMIYTLRNHKIGGRWWCI